MALYKIGVTEAGDAGVDLSWEEKLDDVDAAVLITKCVSPDFFDATLRHKEMFNVGAMMPWMDYTPRTLDEIIAANSHNEAVRNK